MFVSGKDSLAMSCIKWGPLTKFKACEERTTRNMFDIQLDWEYFKEDPWMASLKYTDAISGVERITCYRLKPKTFATEDDEQFALNLASEHVVCKTMFSTRMFSGLVCYFLVGTSKLICLHARNYDWAAFLPPSKARSEMFNAIDPWF